MEAAARNGAFHYNSRALRFHAGGYKMSKRVAGIDVHKRVLMVVMLDPDQPEAIETERFGATTPELDKLKAWLETQGAEEVVMESTAQYWRPVWLALEEDFRLHLAQAWSNRAPRGKKTDFKDAERLVRRYCAQELTLSFVPGAGQREQRELTRRRKQLTRDRVRVQNQIESLLEQMRIKLSSVVSDLLGSSGRRMLRAISEGMTDAEKLAALADERIQCPRDQLQAALTGKATAFQRKLLGQLLQQVELIDTQQKELDDLAKEIFQPAGDAITRLSQVPGIRALAAQQIIAEIGAQAASFPTSDDFSSWAGVCPGRQESAQKNYSSRSTKGNPYLRSALCQAAQAASRTQNSIFQQKLHRFLPRMGYAKALWAVAHHLAVVIWKILHEGVPYIEFGGKSSPLAEKRRLQRVKKDLRALGLSDDLSRLASPAVPV
jgi:transposase